MDLPLSYPLLKLLCQGEVSSLVREKSHIQQQSQNSALEDELMSSSMYSILSEESDLDMSGGASGFHGGMSSATANDPFGTSAWFSHLLSIDDLAYVDPVRGEFLLQIQDLANQKQAILSQSDLGDEVKAAKIADLKLNYQGALVALEDLCLTFQYSPSSSVFGFDSYDLIPNGESEMVTIHNVEDYIQLVLDFTLVRGIRKQMEAFRSGFNQVFPMDKLGSFSPDEVKTMLCGDQCPIFTREDIIRFTEPKLGYTRESPAFLKFVNVLVGFSASERKAFLQFTTGCSSLPPGGLANLFPRMTIVRKIDAGDGSYPSVNTCVHYLKLPDYTTEEVMREKLLMATREKGFHLN